MKVPKINWEDARYFLTVARLGQLGVASTALGVSVMTLSRHLNQLQNRLGSILLTRHSKGMQLTNEGQRLVEYLERAEAEIESAHSIFEMDSQSVTGTVRVSAPEGFALKLLVPQLRSLLEAQPDLSIEVVPQTVGFSLSRRQADLAVMVGQPSESGLRAISLGEYALGLYASKAYIGCNGIPESVDGLSNHRLIGYVDDLLFSERLNIAKSVWSQWTSQIAIYSPIGQVEAVRAGLGIGVLHRFLVDPASELVPILNSLNLTREFFLVSHPASMRIPRVKTVYKFIETLRSSM